MRKVVFLVSVLLVVLLWVACGPAQAPTVTPPPTSVSPARAPAAVPAPGPATPTRAAWEVQWERVQAEARVEGVVAYAIATGREAQLQLASAFKDKFGIRSESITGTGAALASKIVIERRAGLYLWDLYIDGASPPVLTLKPGGATVPLDPALILPEVTDLEVIKKMWRGGELSWVDRDHHMLTPLYTVSLVLAINTDLVKPGEIKSFDDLLNPKWKGKIALLNPTAPGKAQTILLPLLYGLKGEDWVRRFAQQVAVIIGDDRLGVEWLAHGKYPIYMPPRDEMFWYFVRAGAPITTVETEDIGGLSSGTTGISLIGNAPHPNAAKAFINFYLSKEGQTIVSQVTMSPSARLDVPTEGIPSWTLIKPGRKYLSLSTEESMLKVDGYTKKSKEIFGYLLK